MKAFPKIRETRKEVIILQEFVSVTLYRVNINHYKNLGYGGRVSDKIVVHVCDLPTGSNQRILVGCPVCGLERMVRYQTIGENTVCCGCSRLHDLLGMTFGRLLVTGLEKINNNSHWVCECECGTITKVPGISLMSGRTRSCGCYNIDVLKSMSGESSPHWKAHLTDEDRAIARSYPEYTQWVKDVFVRDNYTCQRCGSRDGSKLCAHHIFSYAYNESLRLDPKNGVTLCDWCHYDFHINFMGGWAKSCTDNDYKQWSARKRIAISQ